MAKQHVKRLLISARYRMLSTTREIRSSTVVSTVESMVHLDHKGKMSKAVVSRGGRLRLTAAACAGPVVYEFLCQCELRAGG